MIKELELRRRYDETAGLYDQRYREIQRGKHALALEYLREAKFVLDVGCGTGLLLHELISLGKIAIGVDLSPEMLKVAKERLHAPLLVLADASGLPFRDGCFDAVVSITTLQNVSNPLAALREIARVVKRGGIAVVSTLRRKHSLEELQSWMRETGLRLLSSGEMGEDFFCVARR